MSKLTKLFEKYRTKAIHDFGTSFYHDPVMLGMASLFVVQLVSLLLLLIFRVQPGSVVPLTYNVVYGVTYSSTWFGPYYYLLALAGFGVINYLIAWAYFDKERLLSYLIACVNILLAALMILYIFNLTALVS